jgi:hypothetical protein
MQGTMSAPPAGSSSAVVDVKTRSLGTQSIFGAINSSVSDEKDGIQPTSLGTLMPVPKTIEATAAVLTADIQTLCNEFENRIMLFESTGRQWTGSAVIQFRSAVLSRTTVQITSSGKALNIILTQSGPSSALIRSALPPRQEQALCSALARKLGRAVTLQTSHHADILAADSVAWD